MSMHFAEILEQEIHAAGVTAPCRQPAPLPAPVSSPAQPDSQRPRTPDTQDFSSMSKLLSASLQQLSRDRERQWQRDSGIIAGNSETGYLWKTEVGISGHMHFSTATGVVVDIKAKTENASNKDVVISVRKDDSQFVFAIEELAKASSHACPTPFLALTGAAPSHQEEGKRATRSEACRILSYNAQGMPVRGKNQPVLLQRN